MSAASRPTLVMASANAHKVREIAEIVGDRFTILPRPDDVPDVVEDAPDLVGNARLKAVAICAATGRAAVADDTGLEVDALDGAPGVHSARFAGEPTDSAANRRLVLERLVGVAPVARTARFRTVAFVAFPDGAELVAEGVVEGRIRESASGDSGFGYDPIFVPDDGDGRTLAEMTATEKHAVSARGRAFRRLADLLADLLADPPADPIADPPADLPADRAG